MAAFAAPYLPLLAAPRAPRQAPQSHPRFYRPRCARACLQGVPIGEPLAAPVSDAAAPRAVFCDVDGTLLASDNKILPANVDAVKGLPYPDVRFIPATGKSRAGALQSFGELGDFLKSRYPTGVPGVYLQGLCVYDESGALVYEQTLAPSVSRKVVELSEQLSLSLIAYGRDGDSILCAKADAEIMKVTDYHEPTPIECGSWDAIIGANTIHKFLFMATEEAILAARPAVEAAFAGTAEVTRATPGMLEVLPLGASKGAGVARLQKVLGVSAEKSMAIGDGENDVEMLQLCGTSVAVANAVPVAAAAAKYATLSNDQGGVAAALEAHVYACIK